MVRSTTIRVSKEERELLKRVRQKEFGTDSVPLGEVLELTCEEYLNE